MKLIYFHIDELARDSIVASVLKKEFKKRGVTVIYGNRFSMRFLQKMPIFDLIILSGIPHFQHIFPDPGKLPENIVIMPTEAVGMATGNSKKIDVKYFGINRDAGEPWHKTAKAFMLWGYDHLKPFEKQYPQYLEKCNVIGHPRLDKRCVKKQNKNSGENKKLRVGLVSRFSGVNPFHSKSIFETIHLGMRRKGAESPLFENSPDHDVEDQLYTEMIDLRVFFQIIEKLDLSKFEIWVRPHPRENRFFWERLSRENNLDIKISDWDEPFSFWLSNIDFIVSPPSTSFYDALSAGQSPICTMNIVKHRKRHVLTESDDNNQILEHIRCPESVDEVIELLENPLKSEELSSEAREILLGQTALDIAPNSLNNLADACMKILETASSPINKVKKRAFLALYKIIVVSLSYVQQFRNHFVRGGEQSASFALTLSRIRMINKLSD